MYRPNFCAECGTRIDRARWRLWTSRRFCTICDRRLFKTRVALPILISTTLLTTGYLGGRGGRTNTPPVIIQRYQSPTSGRLSETTSHPVLKDAANHVGENTVRHGAADQSSERPTGPNQVISMCGARTQKGVPCSRRVRGIGRCWQHKGKVAIIPVEKLLINGN